MRVLLAFLVVIAAVYCKPVSYEGYHVYGVTATTDEHLRMLVEWEKAGAFNFWTHPRKDAVTDILVSPTDQPYFELTLRMAQMKYFIKISDVQKLIDDEMKTTYDFDVISYDGYKVYSIFATTDAHMSILFEWERKGTFDFWTHPPRKNAATDIMISPKDQAFFESFLIDSGIDFFVKIENVGDLIENENKAVRDQPKSYENYKLYGVTAVNDDQMKVLLDWEDQGKFDFWTSAPRKNAVTDILVSPSEQAYFEKELTSNKMQFFVKIENLQDLIDVENRA